MTSEPVYPFSPMHLAIERARDATAKGEVPIGAVMVDATTGAIIASAHKLCEALTDPTAHAEMLVIRETARKLRSTRLTECDLYVTLEPCAMCAQAIAFARLRRVYFGAYDPKGGGVEHGARVFTQPTCNHRPEVIGGIEEAKCGALLTQFFAEKRA
jgi:tRNA(adenine34) deaminase